MKKKRRIWIFAVVFAIAAVQGTVFAGAQKTVKKTADGQTLLDVSQGNITITSTGATGGGYKQ